MGVGGCEGVGAAVEGLVGCGGVGAAWRGFGRCVCVGAVKVYCGRRLWRYGDWRATVCGGEAVMIWRLLQR